MMKKIKRSVSSLTLRAFCRNTSDEGMSVLKEGWFSRKRQERSLTQSDPSMDDDFNIAAFYVEGQLDFPNQVPENVLQLYHELYDMEKKVKSLENEIAVYVMSFQNKSRPAMRRGVGPRRKPSNFSRKCCIPGLWNCARPVPVISETYHRNRTMPRPVGLRSTNKRNSVSAAVQTTNLDTRGSRLSKVSWNSKVDVRYISSEMLSQKSQKAPLQGAELEKKANEELKNVVHLKIKIPKDVLNLRNDDGGQVPKRLENEWDHFNSTEEGRKKDNDGITTSSSHAAAHELVTSRQGHALDNQNCPHASCLSRNQTESSRPLRSTFDTSNIVQMKLEAITENESSAGGNTIVGTSVIQNEREESTQSVGIPIKQPGKPNCESQGCSCLGSAKNDTNLEKVRQSFDMTESELSLLEEAVHNNTGPTELKIQTEYGSVNVISHNPDCKCKICETFGSHSESRRKSRGRSDSAAVISKKIVRVHYNGDYRNIVTHTEECGCDICSNIEEHSYKLMSQRPSIVSTHRGELVIKNKGVCGCKNCKTVEMGPHVVDVETMLSRTSSHVLDQCYYSDATIPSMQSFPREGLTTTDDQGASFSSPPSINSSDLSDELYGQSPSASNVNTSDRQVLNVHKCPGQTLTASRVQAPLDAQLFRETNKEAGSRCGNSGDLRVPRNPRNRIYDFVKPSGAKSSPAGLDKHHRKDSECQHCASRKSAKGKLRQEKCEPIPMKSRFSTQKNFKTSIPMEWIPIIDNGETIHQSSNAKVSLEVDQVADRKVSSYNADHITLEELIRDLIRGQPSIQKDKVYTVTLGEVSNKAYTKIHILDCSSTPDEGHKSNTITNGLKKKPAKLPNGNGSDSNVFFIKPLSSSIGISQTNSAGLPDLVDNNASPNSRSSSSPASMQDTMKEHQLTDIASFEDEGVIRALSDGKQGVRVANSASNTSPRSDMPRRAFKLTISFGKKVASFFRQREKRKTMSNHIMFLPEHEVSPDNPTCLKRFTIYEGAEKHLKLLQINVKPRYFTLEKSSGAEEANNPFKQSPILCLVEKNSNMQAVDTVVS